jgi:quercetin dioxygenase-like cupin family protein
MSTHDVLSPQSEEFRTLDLDDELQRAQKSDHGATERLTLPLASLPGLRLVLVSMRAGTSWPEHCTPGRITVQPLSGRIRMRIGDSEMDLRPGHVAALAASVKHDVNALTDAAFLLTVARPKLD